MTFPQPSSTAPVLGAKQSFRLKTGLVSSGDIYESEVSALAFVIGPDSDIANVQVSYFDEDSSTKVATALVTPDRDLIGRIDARNDVNYPGTTPRKGRILINSLDIWDTSFRPAGFNAANDVIEFETPTLDVIQYFVNPPSVIPPRSDKTYRFQYWTAPLNANGITYIGIPAFGRKSGYFTFLNRGNGIATIRTSIYAVKLSTSDTPGAIASFGQLLDSADILTGADRDYQYKASTDGLWDMFIVGLGGGAGPFPYIATTAFPVTVTLSDDPQ